MKAIENGHTEIVTLLLGNGADVNVNAEEEGEMTALILAIEAEHIDTVSLLLEKGADVNVKYPATGWPALMVAIIYRHKEIVSMLLEKGADVHAKDNDGTTALMEASKIGLTDIVRMLKQNGAK